MSCRSVKSAVHCNRGEVSYLAFSGVHIGYIYTCRERINKRVLRSSQALQVASLFVDIASEFRFTSCASFLASTSACCGACFACFLNDISGSSTFSVSIVSSPHSFSSCRRRGAGSSVSVLSAPDPVMSVEAAVVWSVVAPVPSRSTLAVWSDVDVSSVLHL